MRLSLLADGTLPDRLSDAILLPPLPGPISPIHRFPVSPSRLRFILVSP